MNSSELTQQSIDSLFGTESDKAIGMPLDFSARRSLTGDQMEMLTALNLPVVQALGIQLSAWLDADISLSILAVERQLYQSFLSSQDLPALYVTRGTFAHTPSPALLCVDLAIADVVAHYSLGGVLDYSALGVTRSATASDMELLDSLLSRVWLEVNQIWAACEMNARFEERVAPAGVSKVFLLSDNLLVFTYALMIGGVEASLQLCLPSTIADGLLKELYRVDAKHTQPPEVHLLMRQRLGQLPQRMTMHLPSFRMGLPALEKLRVGDVVNTGISSSTLAQLSVRHGAAWQSRACKFESGRLAAQLVRPQGRDGH